MTKKLSILAVLTLAVLATAYSVGGTYAKYTTTVNVTGTAAVAKWDMDLTATDGSDTETTTINLASGLDDSNVADGKIAPGTTKSFTFEVDGTGTEVAYNYTIVLSNFQNMPTNFVISGATDNGDGTYTITGSTVNLADAKVNDHTITWTWAYETKDSENSVTVGDTADTTDGTNAATMTFDATITATQVD